MGVFTRPLFNSQCGYTRSYFCYIKDWDSPWPPLILRFLFAETRYFVGNLKTPVLNKVLKIEWYGYAVRFVERLEAPCDGLLVFTMASKYSSKPLSASKTLFPERMSIDYSPVSWRPLAPHRSCGSTTQRCGQPFLCEWDFSAERYLNPWANC